MERIPSEVWTGLAGLLAGVGAYFAGKKRRTPQQTVTSPRAFDRSWAQGIESQMRKLLGLAHEVAEIARRIDRMEQWQDGHEAEDRKAHERLVIVEQQYKSLSESQGRSEVMLQRVLSESQNRSQMLQRVLDLLETDLKETKRRLLDLERQLQDRRLA